MYREFYLSQLFLKSKIPKTEEAADVAYQMSIDKISIGPKISFGTDISLDKIKLILMSIDYQITKWSFHLLHNVEEAIWREK